MVIVALLLFTLAIAWFVAQPLFCSEPAVSPWQHGETPRELSQQRERLVDALRELETDFAAQRIADDHYNSAKKQLTAGLAAVITKIDSMHGIRNE